MPPDDDNNNSNPFIRFKHHVDTNIQAGINTLATLSRSSDTTTTARSSSPSPSFSPSQPSNTISLFPPGDDHDHNDDDRSIMATSATSESAASAHLESRLDLLRGGTPAEAALAWDLFLTRSAYSPLRLERELGWRPVPRGWSRNNDDGLAVVRHRGAGDDDELSGRGSGRGYEGGWLDAFEDLMRASSGLEMRALGEIQRDRERYREWDGGWFPFGMVGGGFFGGGFFGGWRRDGRYFGTGMGMREVAWLGRMRRAGLTEVLFPVCDPCLGYQSPRTMEEWVERRRRERDAGRAWDGYLEERVKTLEDMQRRLWREADAWTEEARREMEEARRAMERELGAWGGDARDKGTGFFDGVFGGIVKTLGKVLEDEVTSMQRHDRRQERRERADDTAVADQNKQDRSAETEGDLYSLVQSAFHESERSLSNFFRAISDGWREGLGDLREKPKPASPGSKVETTEAMENGLLKRTTKQEFVDEHGNTHAKTETTWTDDDGRVVMRVVQNSSGSSHRWEKTFGGAPAKQDNDREMAADNSREAATNEAKEQKKKTGGWFWK